MVTTAAAPMPAIQPYMHGSISPTDAMLTVPENRLASVSCFDVSVQSSIPRRTN